MPIVIIQDGEHWILACLSLRHDNIRIVSQFSYFCPGVNHAFCLATAPEKVPAKQKKRKRQRRTLSAAPNKKEKGEDVLGETPNSEVFLSYGFCQLYEANKL